VLPEYFEFIFVGKCTLDYNHFSLLQQGEQHAVDKHKIMSATSSPSFCDQ